MITIFAIPRRFRGKFNTIQRNAIKSWLKLGAEVILFGNELGTSDMCKEFDIRQVAHIKKNQHSTPILVDAVKKAVNMAKYPVLAYINCDMVMLPDFKKAIKQIKLKKYLLVGQRRPLVLDQQIVGKKNWEQQIKILLNKQESQPVGGSSDFFVFPKTISWPMPAFAVGRFYWDKWFFYHAKKANIPIIDATSTVSALHQQHYQDVTKHGDEVLMSGEEAKINLQLIGGKIKCFSIFDADYILTDKGLMKKPTSLTRRVRKIEINLIISSEKNIWWWLILGPVRLSRKLLTWLRNSWESAKTRSNNI